MKKKFRRANKKGDEPKTDSQSMDYLDGVAKLDYPKMD